MIFWNMVRSCSRFNLLSSFPCNSTAANTNSWKSLGSNSQVKSWNLSACYMKLGINSFDGWWWEIEQKSIYLYYRNEPRIKKNMECLAHCCSESNPVAFCRVQSSGTHGKSVASHFREESPETAMLCIGAKVCLEGRNFSPTWGLHNGACGFVQEIVFQKGKNPNDKYLPDYVVVDFPQYCGPIWDIDHPTVSNVYCSLFLRISFSSN